LIPTIGIPVRLVERYSGADRIRVGRDLYEAGENINIYSATASPQPRSGPGKIVRLPMRPPPLAGRDSLIDDLRTWLATGKEPGRPRIIVLCGMGGIGKTSIAVEHSYWRLPDLGVVWLFSAGNPVALNAGFADLAAELGGGNHARGRDSVAAVHAVLADRPGGWLLVFDNAAGPGDLRTLLPPTGDGEVIITTQNPFWPGLRVLELPVLGLDDAAEFLVSSASAGDLTAARELAKKLGCLPLALAQAVGYMGAVGCDVDEYLGLYHACGAELRARGDAAGYDKVIATTWALAIDEISRTTPRAKGLLRLLACFAPDDIPVRLILGSGAACAEFLPAVAPDVMALLDEVARHDAIGALRAFCLINRPSPDGSISLHRLVQAVTLDGLGPALAEAWHAAAYALVDAALPSDPQDFASWPAYSALHPHGQATLPCGSQATERIARYLGYSGRLTEARDLLREVADTRDLELGPDHVSSLIARGHLAHWTGRAGDPGAARDQFAALVPRLSRAFGPEHKHTLTARVNQARWTARAGDHAAARDLFAGLVTDLSRTLGPHHPDTLTVRERLAMSTGHAGDPANAHALYGALLADISQANASDDFPLIPLIRQNLARWAKLTVHRVSEPKAATSERSLGPVAAGRARRCQQYQSRPLLISR
jgi:hypothetical protein